MTRGERREKAQTKRRNQMRMAGGSLRTVYKAAVLKRAAKGAR